MLGDVLVLLRDELNAHLRQAAPDGGADAQEDRVQLIDGGQGEPIEFRADAEIGRASCRERVSPYV